MTTSKSKLMGYFNIGWTSNNPATRNIGIEKLITGGWPAFVDAYIKPAIDLGYTRLELHNPFGCLANENMQADQFIHAQNAGLHWLTDNFAKSFQPITSQIEVVSYLGVAHGDADFDKRAGGRLKKDDWLRRMQQSYNAVLDAGMSVGFDAIMGEPYDSPYFHFCEMLRAIGVKCYIETWWSKDCPHWFKYPAMVVDSFYPHIFDGWGAKQTDVSGEPLVFNTACPVGETWETWPNWLPRWCAEFLTKKITPMPGMWGIVEKRLSYEKLMAQINEVPPPAINN